MLFSVKFHPLGFTGFFHYQGRERMGLWRYVLLFGCLSSDMGYVLKISWSDMLHGRLYHLRAEGVTRLLYTKY